MCPPCPVRPPHLEGGGGTRPCLGRGRRPTPGPVMRALSGRRGGSALRGRGVPWPGRGRGRGRPSQPHVLPLVSSNHRPAPAAAPAAEGPRHAGTRVTGSGPGDAEAVCWGPSGPFPGGGRAGETLPCDHPCLGLGEAPTCPGASPPEGTRGGPPNRGATRGGSPAPRPGRLPRGCRRVRREQPE